jgi:hypothetical protein
MHAKAKGAVNMDQATRGCKSLDHFVMWSSFVASAGNEGQTNYVRLFSTKDGWMDGWMEGGREGGKPQLSDN